ncbi:hypothetical protein ANO11243_089180 [Dothideomycetidae sp. 11243]|nr:hypothetical protein ANO11243_089180 [fungal sp. No.11243]
MYTTFFKYRHRKSNASSTYDAYHHREPPRDCSTSSNRPPIRRNSPLSVLHHSNGFAADASMMQRMDVGDSSEDEIPLPISAYTAAILASEVPSQLPSPKQEHVEPNRDRIASQQHTDTNTPSRAPLLRGIVRKPSPHLTRTAIVGSESRNPSPKIVSITRGPDSIRRIIGSGRISRDTTPGSQYVTPGPPSRSLRLGRSRADSNTSEDEHHRSRSRPLTHASARSTEAEDEDHEPRPAFNRSGSAASIADVVNRHNTAASSRSRNTAGETGIATGATRVKRATVGAGSFLRGAPMRRGFRRRESDELPSPNEEYESLAHANGGIGGDALTRSSSRASVDNPQPLIRVAQRPLSRKLSTESLSRKLSNEHLSRRVDSAQSSNHAPTNRLVHKDSVEGMRVRNGTHQEPAQRRPSVTQGSYKVPPSRIHDAALDQENICPPTFKRNNDSEYKVLGHSKPGVLSAKVIVSETPVPVPQKQQSSRPALGALSGNTPQRPAPPPPPKMSTSDMATKAAGASAIKLKKRRAHVVLNGKTFSQLGKLGKGGSSDVYSVMAENHKLFALKKVKLGDCDETALRGYKGEIDLLKKLDDVERVIRLYDWELDEARGTLCLLMEKGEGDLNRVLSQVLGSNEPKLDTVFIRWWWREMLSCVSAVHAYDIVHSDLKPANFLVVGGQLKLIDFGIANAIDIDNTVNVHRDTHIGTPNYMSPESINDTNAPVPGQPRTDPAGGRMMKLGKPSDVWSLGCILYQMVYGRAPFAHIPNQIHRIMAITNPAVVINFPSEGLGGVPVPPELKGTLRRCLQRDPSARPTVDTLLKDDDPFLYPDAAGRVAMSEELLGIILAKVVDKCRRGEAPSDADVPAWANGFLSRVRSMVEMEGVKEGVSAT